MLEVGEGLVEREFDKSCCCSSSWFHFLLLLLVLILILVAVDSEVFEISVTSRCYLFLVEYCIIRRLESVGVSAGRDLRAKRGFILLQGVNELKLMVIWCVR